MLTETVNNNKKILQAERGRHVGTCTDLSEQLAEVKLYQLFSPMAGNAGCPWEPSAGVSSYLHSGTSP